MTTVVGSWKWAEPPVYIEETTAGTCPGNPATKWIGAIQSFGWNETADAFSIPQAATPEARETLPGIKGYDVSIEYVPSDTDFAKYGVNAPNGTGTIAKTISILGQMPVSGVTEYFLGVNAVHKKFSMKYTHGKEVRFTSNLLALTSAGTGFWSTSDPIGTGSWAADSGAETAPSYSFDSGGDTPIVIGAYSPNLLDFTCDIDWGTKATTSGGSHEPWAIDYTTKKITGSFTAYWVDLNYLGLLANQTSSDIVWTLKTDGDTLTLADAILTKVGVDIPLGDAVAQKFSFVANSAVLT